MLLQWHPGAACRFSRQAIGICTVKDVSYCQLYWYTVYCIVPCTVTRIPYTVYRCILYTVYYRLYIIPYMLQAETPRLSTQWQSILRSFSACLDCDLRWEASQHVCLQGESSREAPRGRGGRGTRGHKQRMEHPS